jgi:hypothetical protein
LISSNKQAIAPLFNKLLDSDSSVRQAVKNTLIKLGISSKQLVDFYISFLKGNGGFQVKEEAKKDICAILGLNMNRKEKVWEIDKTDPEDLNIYLEFFKAIWIGLVLNWIIAKEVRMLQRL